MSFRNETKRRSVNVYAKAEGTVRAQCLINGATFICIQVNGRKRKNNLLLACGMKIVKELSTYLLSQLYANKGEQKRAIQLIDDAIVKFPQVPYFHFEKIKYLLDLEQYEEMLAVIDNINTQRHIMPIILTLYIYVQKHCTK